MALREQEVAGWVVRVYASEPDELRATIWRRQDVPGQHGSSRLAVNEHNRERLADELLRSGVRYVEEFLT